MIVRPMGFDPSKLYGPSNEWAGNNWLLKVSPKTCEYDCPSSAGYDCDIALTSLESTMHDAVHVCGFRVSGLHYDYGWNAVRLFFDQDKRSVHIDSQSWASDETCVLTCVVESNKQVHIYVESGINIDRLPRLDHDSKPLKQDENGVLYYHTVDLDSAGPIPSLRFAMMQGNRVTIESPWNSRAYKEYVTGKYGRGIVYA